MLEHVGPHRSSEGKFSRCSTQRYSIVLASASEFAATVWGRPTCGRNGRFYRLKDGVEREHRSIEG